MLTLAVFTCLVGLSTQAGLFFANSPSQKPDSVAWSKPWFCHENDCPSYTVVDTNSKYETRAYEGVKWVQANITTMIYGEKERRSVFNKLFNYIAGNNSNHQKIAMTTPVVTEIRHGPGPDCESDFTMNFFIPYTLQANPPTPTEDGVRIFNESPFTVYVKSYGGFSTDELKRQNIEEFASDLMADNKSFDDRVYFTAAYDGPYAFTNRHNEIWVIPK